MTATNPWDAPSWLVNYMPRQRVEHFLDPLFEPAPPLASNFEVYEITYERTWVALEREDFTRTGWAPKVRKPDGTTWQGEFHDTRKAAWESAMHMIRQREKILGRAIDRLDFGAESA